MINPRLDFIHNWDNLMLQPNNEVEIKVNKDYYQLYISALDLRTIGDMVLLMATDMSTGKVIAFSYTMHKVGILVERYFKEHSKGLSHPNVKQFNINDKWNSPDEIILQAIRQK